MVISYEHKDLLWRHGALTYDNPRGLFYAVFLCWLVVLSLRGQEQRNLVWNNFKCIPEDPQIYNEDTCYEYIEFASKNNQHRFSDIHLRNKCAKAYSSVGSVKCIVKILDCYKRRVPQEPKAFYLCPLDKPWFVNMPVGINTLNNVVSKVSKSLDVTLPNYTNHSLRATAASCMFEKRVPEKIIVERTGHRSLSGLRAYEKSLLKSKQKLSVMQCYSKDSKLLLLMIIQ